MAYQVACLLLRPTQWMMMPPLIHRSPDAGMIEVGQARPAQRFSELLREAVHWHGHTGDWYLHGPPTGQAVPPRWPPAAPGRVGAPEALAYVEQLAQAYAWCLLPWGVEGTGQLLLILAADAMRFTTFMTQLRLCYDPEAYDPLVSLYTAEDLRARRFRGAIFRRAAAWRGRGLWQDGRGTAAALVLRSDLAGTPPTPPAPPAGAEVVMQVHVSDLLPVFRTWLHVHDEDALLHYVTDSSTLIVTAGDLDDHLLRDTLGAFSQPFVDIRNDPLYFGLKALQSASWIYLPATPREGWEIYLNHDPTVTSRLLQSPALTQAPGFVHRYFC